MKKITNAQRKSIVTISVGAWIRSQREGDLKATLASKLVENGYSQNAAYSVAKRVINALKDEQAIHITKSGQLSLKRRLDAEYIGSLCDRVFGRVAKPTSAEPVKTVDPKPVTASEPSKDWIDFETSGNLVRIKCSENVYDEFLRKERIAIICENYQMQEFERRQVIKPTLKSFKDEELVAELRLRGWDVKCKKTQVVEL